MSESKKKIDIEEETIAARARKSWSNVGNYQKAYVLRAIVVLSGASVFLRPPFSFYFTSSLSVGGHGWLRARLARLRTGAVSMQVLSVEH